MTPRSDPHTEAIREGIASSGFPADPAKTERALAALAALESERDEVLERDGHHLRSWTIALEKLAAAEARVTQLEEALALTVDHHAADCPACERTRLKLFAPGSAMTTIARSALGVVADGGGGRDE